MHGLSQEMHEERPLILVTADERTFDGYKWHATPDTYLKALTGAGANPVVLPSLGSALNIESLVSRFDGILVTGSRSNVHPDRYGKPAREEDGPFDPARDATSLPLIRTALDQGVPLLAICRGIQELNVALGGTLHTAIHDLEDRDNHQAPVAEDHDERFRIAQDVKLKPGGELIELLGPSETVRVNSLHRQGIDELADGLQVEAWATDGTIEAVQVINARSFALGVQWHPEYWAASDPPSKKLFTAFIDAARAHRQALTHTAT